MCGCERKPARRVDVTARNVKKRRSQEERRPLMSHRSLASTAALAALAVAVLAVLLAPSPATGQNQSSAANTTAVGRAWTLPHTPDGKPDLQGVWTNNTLTPLERPKNLGV